MEDGQDGGRVSLQKRHKLARENGGEHRTQIEGASPLLGTSIVFVELKYNEQWMQQQVTIVFQKEHYVVWPTGIG